MEMVFTCHGSSLPQFCSAVRTAYSSPPQHGTSMRTTVTLFDVVLTEDFGQLLAVIHIIQLGTADERYLPPDKILMEVCVRVSGAVCRDEQVCAVKIRRIHRHELICTGHWRSWLGIGMNEAG